MSKENTDKKKPEPKINVPEVRHTLAGTGAATGFTGFAAAPIPSRETVATMGRETLGIMQNNYRRSSMTRSLRTISSELDGEESALSIRVGEDDSFEENGLEQEQGTDLIVINETHQNEIDPKKKKKILVKFRG